MDVAAGQETTVGGQAHRGDSRASLTLAQEHLLLMGQVSRRARAVLAEAAGGRWPGREARALLDYLHAVVLRQASDEERLLFPAAAPEFARLTRDHARLNAVVEALAQASAEKDALSLPRLAVLTRDLLAMLERHLHAEDELMAAAMAPAAGALAHRPS